MARVWLGCGRQPRGWSPIPVEYTYTYTHIIGAQPNKQCTLYTVNCIQSVFPVPKFQVGPRFFSLCALAIRAFFTLLVIHYKFPRHKMKCIEENQKLHEIFRAVSRFPRYTSCYIAESRLPLGQCRPLKSLSLILPACLPHSFPKIRRRKD